MPLKLSVNSFSIRNFYWITWKVVLKVCRDVSAELLLEISSTTRDVASPVFS